MIRISPLVQRLATIAALVGTLSAFSQAGGIGGTGAPQGGIGGTGVTAIGVIQRFGSIYVNGREYLLSAQTHYWVDGRPAHMEALHRGQDVFVDAWTQGANHTARSVRVQHALIGVVQKAWADGRQLRILGQDVTLSTQASARLQQLEQGGLRPGMELAISAGSPAPGTWVATRARVVHQQPGHKAPFLIRGVLHRIARHAIALDNRLFVWTGATAPASLVGHYVVARGYYRSGHPVATSLRAAAGLQDAKRRILMAGYLRATARGWRFEGEPLTRGGERLAISTRRPVFLAIRRETPDRFVIVSETPHVRMMTYGLHSDRDTHRERPSRPVVDRPALAHHAVAHPRIARPDVARPQTALLRALSLPPLMR